MLGSSTPDGLAPLNNLGVLIFVSVICALCIGWSIFNGIMLIRYGRDEEAGYSGGEADKMLNVIQINEKIRNSIFTYIKFNSIVSSIFVFVFYLIILGALEKFNTFYTSTSFIIGAINSILLSAFIAFVGTIAHLKLGQGALQSISKAHFIAKLASNCQTFFSLGFTVLIVSLTLVIYEGFLPKEYDETDIAVITEALIGFSFGSASVLILSRISSCIFGVGASKGLILMRGIESRLKYDNRNPLIICKSIGEVLNKQVCNNLGFITLVSSVISLGSAAGGTKIIGSDQEGEIIFDIAINNIYLPILSVCFSLFFSLLVNIVIGIVIPVSDSQKVRFSFLLQILAASVFHVGFMSLAAYLSLPAEFQIKQLADHVKYPYHAYLCIMFGMFGGIFIMFATELLTNSPFFVNSMMETSRTGSATGIIYGLSFGYLLTPLPIIILTGIAFISCYWLGVFGVCMTSIGYLSLLPLYSTINNYYSITQNTSLILFICKMSEQTIGSVLGLSSTRCRFQAHIQSLLNGLVVLIGYNITLMFIIDSGLKSNLSLSDSHVFTGILMGAMIPYLFSSILIRYIKKEAINLCLSVKDQIDDMPGILQGTVEPDSMRIIRMFSIQVVSTIKFFMGPLLFPFVVMGIAFGPKQVAGFTIGVVISSVQLCISSGLSGSIWNNVTQEMRSGNAKDSEDNVIRPESDWGKAAEVGGEISPEMKDGIAMAVPNFILYVGLLSCVMSKIYVNIHGV